MPEPTKPENNEPTNQPAGGNNEPTNNQGGQPAAPEIDFSKLEGPQLEKVLENPNLWKTPRLSELLQHSKDLKKFQEDKAKADEENLTKNKEWETLANNRATEIETLKGQLNDMALNQSLTVALTKESVVDLDGALKLVDRNKLTVEDGQVKGIDEAIAALKADKAYLFNANGGNQPKLGGASNGDNKPNSGAPMKFKRSQLRDPEFYKENREEIIKAMNAGLIEDDL